MQYRSLCNTTLVLTMMTSTRLSVNCKLNLQGCNKTVNLPISQETFVDDP